MYTLNVTFGTQKLCFEFTISLEEQKFDEKVMLMRLIERLNRKLEQQEKKNRSLEAKIEENQMSEIALYAKAKS